MGATKYVQVRSDAVIVAPIIRLTSAETRH